MWGTRLNPWGAHPSSLLLLVTGKGEKAESNGGCWNMLVGAICGHFPNLVSHYCNGNIRFAYVLCIEVLNRIFKKKFWATEGKRKSWVIMELPLSKPWQAHTAPAFAAATPVWFCCNKPQEIRKGNRSIQLLENTCLWAADDSMLGA